MFQETKNVLRISSALKLMSVVDGGVILSSDIFFRLQWTNCTIFVVVRYLENGWNTK